MWRITGLILGYILCLYAYMTAGLALKEWPLSVLPATWSILIIYGIFSFLMIKDHLRSSVIFSILIPLPVLIAFSMIDYSLTADSDRSVSWLYYYPLHFAGVFGTYLVTRPKRRRPTMRLNRL